MPETAYVPRPQPEAYRGPAPRRENEKVAVAAGAAGTFPAGESSPVARSANGTGACANGNEPAARSWHEAGFQSMEEDVREVLSNALEKTEGFAR